MWFKRLFGQGKDYLLKQVVRKNNVKQIKLKVVSND